MKIVPFLMLLLIPMAFGATISGSIYDPDLNLAKNAIVSISTKPVQTFVSKDGSYKFTVQKGRYEISATMRQEFDSYFANITVDVESEGDFISDIIMEPDFSGDEELLNEDIEAPQLLPDDKGISWMIIIVISLAIVAGAIYLSRRKRKSIVNEDLAEEIIFYIKGQGGRTTQKEIRKQFPVSEATISLALRELEGKGKIEKFKKGKGNLIVLKS